MMEESNLTKLAKASINYLNLTAGDTFSGQSLNGVYNEPDKLTIPKDWSKLIEQIRFYYERDPIASTVINKSVDIGINELINVRGEASDEVYNVYEYFKPQLYNFLKLVAREYLLSGLVIIPEMTWKTIKINDKNYILPDVLWIRDSATIVAKKTPIPGRINYYVKIEDTTVDFILNKGVYPDGTKDEETYNILRKKYPKFVKSIESGETEILLEDTYIVLTRSPISGKVYPTPYLMPVLESLNYKRNLRKMDYSIASRVISAIQLFTLGDKDFPLTEDDEYQLTDLKNQINWRGQEGNIERVFQLFGNHTLKIEWIYPDTRALLDNNKYKAVDQDILFGLGFPRILLSGETERSATSNAEFAMFSPSESIKAMRKELLPFLNKLYADIAKRNNFDVYPRADFGNIRLYDVEKMANVAKDMYEKGVISRTSYLNTIGHTFDDEVFNMIRERDVMKKERLPEFTPQPFTPQPKIVGDNNQVGEE